MAHNCVQILSRSGDHLRYADLADAKEIVLRNAGIPEYNESGQHLKRVFMIVSERRYEKSSWNVTQSGRYGPLVMQMDT